MRYPALLAFGVTATTLLATSRGSAHEAPPPGYVLSMQLRDGDRLVGSPRMIVAPGEMATVAIGATGGDHCRVSVTTMPREGGRVAVSSVVDIVSAGHHRGAAPAMVVRLGEPTQIAVSDAGQRGRPFRVELTVVRAG